MELRDGREPDWQLLVRYLDGQCTPDERAVLMGWVHADPARRRLLVHLERLWEAAEASLPDASVDDATVAADWERLRGRLELHRPVEPARPVDAPVRRPDRAAGVRRRSHRHAFAAVLAVFLVAVGMLGWFAGSRVTPEPEQALREIATEAGQRARVQLGDGTIVRLNVGSRLRIPATFAVESREVFLEGEAYFDVASSPRHPFTVHAREAVVQVHGTAFDVLAYDDVDSVAVVVAEGVVSMRAQRSPASAAVTLTAHQAGTLDAAGSVHVAPADPARRLGWLEGRLVFEDEPLREVGRTLERWYGLTVHVADAELGERRLTAQFADESITGVLKVVASALDARYELDRPSKTVTFYR